MSNLRLSSLNTQMTRYRSLKEGDEILDNYGYHYAVMPREERQRKLYNQ
jgi:hypothetical protein